MKPKNLYILVLLLLLASCASVKTAKIPGPEGEWDYSITGTPNGDYSGVMAIAKNENSFTGSLNTTEGTTPLNNLSYKPEEKKLEAEFDYQGMTIILTGTVNGDEFVGTVSAGDYEFPMKGTRKK